MEITLPFKWDRPLHPVNDCCTCGEDGEAIHDAETKLLGCILIADVPHHIEAWQVNSVDEKGAHQEAVCPDCCHFDEIVNAMDIAAGQTVEINERTYFVVVTPFED
jgi:hypothetical protein